MNPHRQHEDEARQIIREINNAFADGDWKVLRLGAEALAKVAVVLEEDK
jgi:hypothetical protein